MKLGFVGLGQMGRPIAANLLRGGASLVVSDRSDRWFAEFRSKGATGTTDLADMAAADVIFLCLPSSAAVEGVLLGEGGLLGHLGQGQAVVDLSTITYATTLAIGRRPYRRRSGNGPGPLARGLGRQPGSRPQPVW